jgi:hypothetical protein
MISLKSECRAILLSGDDGAQCIFGEVILCDGDERARSTPQRLHWVATITQHEKKSLSLAMPKQRSVARDPIKWKLTPCDTSSVPSSLPPPSFFFFLSTFVSVTLFLSYVFFFFHSYLSSSRTSVCLHVSYFQFSAPILKTCTAITTLFRIRRLDT